MIVASGMYVPVWFEWLLIALFNWPITLGVIVAMIVLCVLVIKWRSRCRS